MRRAAMAADHTSVKCSWCGVPVDVGDGYRLAEEPGARSAVFRRRSTSCHGRSRGRTGSRAKSTWTAATVDRCAHCDEPLGEVRVVLVRHRGAHRIPDGFCSVDHLRAWAAAGGRWR